QLVEKASLITVVSKQMENAMVTHGLTGKFVRLPNTVDTAVFNYKGDQQSSGMKLLHVSMLVDREKNVSGLIRAMSKLTSETNLELHIVGSGNDEAALKKLATDLRLSDRSVFFEGYKTNDEIAAMMNDSGALIMFSNFEGMPVTIIEAQCCGLPVIATKVGAIPEMIEDNKDGALIAANDEDALVNAIKFYIGKRNTFDRRSISEKAKEQYSLQHVGLKLQQIYSSILSDDAK
ncbi:MAG TPA: glycosyltransferase, partial [Bacteroidia bacterium]|nr:glycosyltransferase [Bacteroidia bacterium]